jgi:hypothetical protein
MLHRVLLLAAFAGLAACGTADNKWASDAEIAAVRYTAAPPATITLITSINNRSGEGAHSGLLISGSERVIYDPAGSWDLPKPWAPERADLHYGITDTALASYLNYQSGEKYRAVMQTVVVPTEVADRAIAGAVAAGAANKAYCANTIAKILRDLPGFEAIGSTMFPRALARDFAELPGVSEKIHAETGGVVRDIPVSTGTGIQRATWEQVGP